MKNRTFAQPGIPFFSLTCVMLICCYVTFIYLFQLKLSESHSLIDVSAAVIELPLTYLLGGAPVIELDGVLLVQQLTSEHWLPLQPLLQDTALYAACPMLLLLVFTLLVVGKLRTHGKRSQLAALSPIAELTVQTTTARAPEKNATLRNPQRMQTAILTEVQVLREKGAALALESITDKLTGLCDRHAFLDQLDVALNYAKQHQQMLSVLFIDLDGFKQVNDSFGHSIGDEVLATVSQRLQERVRLGIKDIGTSEVNPNHLARLGGDEFALLIQGQEAKSDAVTVAALLLEEIEHEIRIGNKSIHISASIGIASYPESANRPEMLLQMADVAMYRAKTDGKGVYRIYSSEMGNKVRRYHYLLEEMRGCIKNSAFTLHFQPIIKVSTCQVLCFEALIRWEHEQEGNITPSEFIPIAEESNMILAIGDWVLREACTHMHRWFDAGMRRVRVSVNVSPVQIRHRNLYEWVMAELTRAKLPASCLTLEITESCLLDATAEILDQVHRLREAGVFIAIDDFGTGFSSLSMLATLPIDVLKIDRSFVSQARESAKHRKILLSIAELAKELGLTVVAEGVEHTEELAIMQEIGIDSIQGFLVSRPQPSKSVDRKIFGEGIGQVAAIGTRIWAPGS